MLVHDLLIAPSDLCHQWVSESQSRTECDTLRLYMVHWLGDRGLRSGWRRETERQGEVERDKERWREKIGRCGEI